MINVQKADSRYSADHGWLQSNFSFSFADYYDPNNMSFGPLRVLNDDFIAARRGFGAHPHREMEIVSVVLKGHLQHQDSTGQKAVTTFGEIQRMTAGTGVVHSEMNAGDDEVNLLQLWFLPEENGLTPSYEVSKYDPDQMKNRLLPVVSKQSGPGVAHIHQDMTLYLSDLEEGQTLTFEQPSGRRVYLFVIEGSLSLNGEVQLAKRDAAHISHETSLQIETESGARFMLIDLP